MLSLPPALQRAIDLVRSDAEAHATLARLEPLQVALGYHFQHWPLLRTALTHKSYAVERQDGWDSYGVLEFVGDSVLDLIVAHRLWRQFPTAQEGVLTRLRITMVAEGPLASVAASLGLGEFVYLGKGATAQGLGARPAVLSDVLEAVLAAVYFDAVASGRGAVEAAAEVVERVMGDRLDALTTDSGVDAKSRLQWEVQATHKRSPRYAIVSEEADGFRAEVFIEGPGGAQVLGTGRGVSHQDAEMAAARVALARLPLDAD